MSHRIEDILDQCLALIAQGRTVEECLARYPEQARVLEPLLRTAAQGRRALGTPQPSLGARAAGKGRLLTALGARRQPRRSLLPVRGWALGAASLLLALFLGSGTVLASFQSLPEQPLYSVKKAVEQVELALAPSTESQAHTLVRHSEKRLKEIEALENRGQRPAAEALRQVLNRQLVKAQAMAVAVEQRGGNGTAVLAAMEQNLARYKARLLGTESTPQPLNGQMEGAAREETPLPGAVPVPRPPAAPPGLQRPAKKLAPQARREVEKALDDYEAALERLKAEIERHSKEKKPPPPGKPRKPRPQQPPPRRSPTQ